MGLNHTTRCKRCVLHLYQDKSSVLAEELWLTLKVLIIFIRMACVTPDLSY